MTLYEALRIGGFNYPSENDINLMDSEGVTLGQRKNQLSRRVRLAKKQNSSSTGTKLGNNNSGDDDEVVNAKNLPSSSHMNGGNSQGINSRTEPLFTAEVRNDAGALHHPKRPRSTLGARALQMKRDVDFTLDESDLVEEEYKNNGTNMMEERAKRPRVAKYHPDYAPLIVPPASFRGNFDTPNYNTGKTYQVKPEQNLMHGMDDDRNVTGATSTMNVPASSPYGVTLTNLTSGPFFNPHLTDALSNHHLQHPPRASAVAVSSLTSSAHAVGLTLEQLALALSSNASSLAKLVAETRSGESMAKQEELALNLFETESKALYTKCMLMAGIDASLAQPNTPTYDSFALKAWQAEGKRLQKMMNIVKLETPEMDDSDILLGETVADSTKLEDDAPGEIVDSACHESGHDHVHSSANIGPKSEDEDHDSSSCDAQHLHRLADCGHKPIIHQPKDGPAHIDFVVNDQVECYLGLESVPFGRSINSAWPSKYKCKEVDESCAKACGKNVLEATESGGSEPKILKLSDINLQDPEWNYDAHDAVDGGVMGLFKLGGDGSI